MNKKQLQIFFLLFLIFIASCTTQKNTAITRSYHNLTAHYNVYFNGLESFRDAERNVNAFKDDYSVLLPIFKYNYPDALKTTSSDIDRTLQKMGKTISKHSITVKPKIKGKLTPKDKEFLKKNEYCKWIDDAYLLIGKADFYKSDYDKALRAFHRILNLYKNENSRFEAELWIAKVYIAQQKYTDALNLLTKLENDVRHPKNLDKEIFLTFADLYIHKKDYPKTISYLKKAIELSHNKKEKARLYYIIAQLEHLQGNDQVASDYFKKVIKMNTDYDMTFSAKIMRATVFSEGQNSDDIKKQLKKMLKDEKNEDYKDQIYYALATIEQKENNTDKAIEYYKLSAQSSVNNNTQKALSFLALADIYFSKKDFLNAGNYYDSTMQYLNKNYPDYDKISVRAENTGLLVKYLSEVQTQDSLQRIAAMPEKERNEFIDKLIQEVIRKEQEQLQNNNNAQYLDPNDFVNQNTQTSQNGKWYMYNQVLVSRGQNEFKKKWGNRKLEDNWRRKNKNMISDFGENQQDTAKVDSNRVTDNKKREYYLQDLPLNDSLLAISDKKIENALFNAAEVYQTKLNELPEAAKTYEELLNRFPDTKMKLETYYRLYNIYKKLENTTKTDYYKSLIINQFPDSKYAKMILDPNYIDKIKRTEDKVLAIFDKTLKEYEKFNYQKVINLADNTLKQYPENTAKANFIFLKALSYGNLGHKDSLIFYLNYIIQNFQDTDVAKQAQDILNVEKSGKYNYDIYSEQTDDKYFLVIIINKKLNTTEFRFKLKTKAENFSNTKSFVIKNEKFDNKNSILTVQTFDNLQEAEDFYNLVLNSDVFDNIETKDYTIFFISKTNYDIFLKDRMIDKYLYFFKKL